MFNLAVEMQNRATGLLLKLFLFIYFSIKYVHVFTSFISISICRLHGFNCLGFCILRKEKKLCSFGCKVTVAWFVFLCMKVGVKDNCRWNPFGDFCIC
jgi:hypothetical protein